ncbi:MAG: DMT family transporter [Marinobacter sp.]|nr:DMT family transporter [Marinobacter sp.]
MTDADLARRHRLTGFLIAGSGVLLLSPDSLIIKSTDVSPLVFLFWRGLWLMVGFGLITGLRYGTRLPAVVRSCGWSGVYCALAFSVSNVGFVVGVKYTAAGNVLVILNTAPVIAALLGWLVWRERLPTRTWLVILICVSGASLMAVGELGQGRPLGLLMAALAAVALASNLAVARSRPDVDTSVMLIFGAAVTTVVAAAMGGAVWPGWRDFGLMMVLCLGFMPAATTLIQIGPRYLPAAEVSLLLLLETVIGSLLVWLFIGEVPPRLSLAGGGLILLTLAVNGLWEDWHRRRKSARG